MNLRDWLVTELPRSVRCDECGVYFVLDSVDGSPARGAAPRRWSQVLHLSSSLSEEGLRKNDFGFSGKLSSWAPEENVKTSPEELNEVLIIYNNILTRCLTDFSEGHLDRDERKHGCRCDHQPSVTSSAHQVAVLIGNRFEV